MIYRLLLLLLTPVLLAILCKHSIQRQGGCLYLWQRLSWRLPRLNHCLWLHCASVGEVNTALPLLTALQQQYPDKHFLITTNTPTGKQAIQHKLGGQLSHCYLPLDYHWSIQRFLSATRPTQALIMETELWPNLFLSCHQHSIPLTIINARLSNKTLQAPRAVRLLYQDCLQYCTAILTQSKRQSENFAQLANSSQGIKTTGNLKWVITELDKQQLNKLCTIQQPYIAAISTHADEETLIAKAMRHINASILLVVIPRHPERRQHIMNSLQRQGINCVLRSENTVIKDDTQVYIADTIGEIPQLITLAEFVIIGGSFIPHGGQNFLEAAILQKAILCGLYMHNFAELCQEFLQQKALWQIQAEQLPEALNSLLNNLEKRQQLANNAYRLSQQNQHIVHNYIDALTID